jgi:hypothetical protein
VGNGNIHVGSETQSRDVGRRAGGPQGAMCEQSQECAPGNQSIPQKLVQLVGYRDPNARPATWLRQRASEATVDKPPTD